MDSSFQSFLSQVASRLRHDLKGGLLTLKMGLESLPSDESLKPLLLEKAQELVDLADKLVLLLRMGEVSPQPVRPESLLGQTAVQAEALYPPLRLTVRGDGRTERWSVDPDAVAQAILELCHNALLARASEVTLEWESAPEGAAIRLVDDGVGVEEESVEGLSELTEVGVSRWGRGGLGLAVVERCAAAHGGSFSLRGEPAGTTARLQFGPGSVI